VLQWEGKADMSTGKFLTEKVLLGLMCTWAHGKGRARVG
jgi:hypothetical protein